MRIVITLTNGKKIYRTHNVVRLQQLLHPSGMKWSAFIEHFGGNPVWEAKTTVVKSITILTGMPKAKTKVCVSSKR